MISATPHHQNRRRSWSTRRAANVWDEPGGGGSDVAEGPRIVDPHAVGDDGVLLLRARQAIIAGGLQHGVAGGGRRMVCGHSPSGAVVWLPAVAVWPDADERPDSLTFEGVGRPWSVGLGVAGDRPSAVLAGLSDRLGWEAYRAFERGAELPLARRVVQPNVGDVVLIDGRLGHDVPTVLAIGSQSVHWGIGSTWERATRRALYGGVDGDTGSELDAVVARLESTSPYELATVDLGSAVLARAGVHRLSVQIVR